MRQISHRLPTTSSIDTFMAEKLNKQMVFSGCDKMEAAIIVWLLNTNISCESSLSTSKFQYHMKETRNTIENGAVVATQDGEQGWRLAGMRHDETGGRNSAARMQQILG